MTFLELCQKLASESGTAGDGLPAAVTGQTGRLAKMIAWVNNAWHSVQNAEKDWLWMQGSFSGPTLVNQRNYDGNDMGVASRFDGFVCSGEDEDRYTIYLTATGVSDEGQLNFLPYRDFQVTQMRGTQTTGRPQLFTIDPSGDLLLSPIPDASYTVKGPYRKDIQTLTANADVPEMPVRYHMLIVEVALTYYLGTHDESPQVGSWQLRQIERYNQLRRAQLPRIELGGALA